jgi:hypothetical protein
MMTCDNIKERYKNLIYKLLFPHYQNNMLQCLSQIIKENFKSFNISLLSQIIRETNLTEFLGLTIADKIQFKFIAYIIENIPSLELIESLNQHLFIYSKQENVNKEEYIRNYNDCLKGLLLIYKDESKCSRFAIAACKILICLCSNDSSGEAITSIINHDALTLISKRLNTYDYPLFQLNMVLSFAISQRIKKVNLIDTFSNSKLLFDEINRALKESIYRDELIFILNNLTKVLYNFLASDDKKGLIRTNIISQIKESNMVTVLNTCLDDNSDNFTDNNIICHLLNYLKLPYLIESVRNESFVDFLKYLKELKHDNIRTCDRFIQRRFDYRPFYKQCSIDDRIIKFFQLLLTGNNSTDIINYFIFRYNLFKLLFEYKKLATLKYIFINFIRLSEKNEDKHDNSDFIAEFPKFLICLCRLFGFIFYLLDGNQQALNELNRKDYFKEYFYNLFDTVNRENENIAIKNIINDNKYSKDLSLYLSTLHSLKTNLYPPEKDEEIDIIINNRK